MENKTKKKLLLKPSQIVIIIVTVIVTAIMITADCFASKYAPIISTFLGCTEQLEGDTSKVEEGAKSGDEVVRKLADDGVVLMKNAPHASGGNTLPLPASQKNINVFGWYATDAGFLLAGNGSGRSYVHPDNKVTFLQALKAGGFNYNDEIIKIYEKHRTTEDADWGESANWNNRYNTKLKEPQTATAFPADVVTRAKEFSDTAVVVLSRYSGEYIGRISSTQKKSGLPEDTTRSVSEISTEEETLIKMCTSNFDRVIVIFNTGSIMDMTFIDDEENFGKIGAAMNVGYMGQSGATAIPKILSGEISPSGKLADTVLYDPDVNEISRVNGESKDIVYAEDIYVGYKFYETADKEGYFKDKTKFGKTGYDAVVQYPFGHGLSYTTFDWEIESVSLPDGEELTKETEIELKVKVTNSGNKEGKDVVQLYYTAPYIKGGIEKSAVNLLDFAKTKSLKPQESDVVTFTFTPYEMASYDCYDKNGTETTGWELDIGKYEIKLMTDSHHLKPMEQNTLTYEINDFVLRYRKDPVSNGRIRNRFTGELAYGECALDGSTLGVDWKYLSRGDIAGTVPKERCKGLSDKTVAPYANYQYDLYDYTQKPVMGRDGGLRLVTKEDGSTASEDELTGKKEASLKYNEELIFKLGQKENWNAPEWDTLLNQLTEEDLRTIVEDGGYGTRAAASIGKLIWWDYDGPSGFNRTNLSPNVEGSKMTALPAENLVAQTWSKQLVYQSGQIIGIDGQNFGISGIYAPCINLHREMLNGRNYECYSEDPILSGYLAANFVRGAKSNGVYSFLKHLALYDSSPYTDKRVWCTEQNFRENYLKPFEIAIKKGEAIGAMVSFNKIGATWAGANQAMIDGVLRTEFGFKGIIVTDYDDGGDSNMKLRAGIRAGVNTQLNPLYGKAGTHGRLNMNDAVDVNLARESAKQIIYASCNTYYFAKNNTDKNEYSTEISGPRVLKKSFEWWIPVVIVINIAVFGVLVWRGLVAFLPKRKAVAAGVGETAAEVSDGGGKSRKGFFDIFKRKKKNAEQDTFEVVGGDGVVKSVSADGERIRQLETENAELKRAVEELTEKLAAFEAERPKKKK